MVIYWKSAAALEAIGLGKPVINFNPGELLSWDPLFKCNALKWTITPDGRLPDAIRVIEHMDETTYQQEVKKARQFISAYFAAVTEPALALFKLE